MAAKKPESRRRPRQRRSRETVDAILEAAARIFAEKGRAGATTNHIARAAGVSVGSLYEYFGDKDAILVALVERQVDGMVATVQAEIEAAAGAGLEEMLRRFVETMLLVHEREPDLYRLAFAEADHPAELHACVLHMEEGLAHGLETLLRESPEVDVRDYDTAAHLIVQSAEALAHRFVHQGIHDLARDGFVEEVLALLVGYARGAGLRAADARTRR